MSYSKKVIYDTTWEVTGRVRELIPWPYFPLKPWAEELSVCRQTSLKIFIVSTNRGSKDSYLCFCKVMIIPHFIPRKIFRGINPYWDICFDRRMFRGCCPRVSDHFAGIEGCQKRVRIHSIVFVENGRYIAKSGRRTYSDQCRRKMQYRRRYDPRRGSMMRK